MILVLNNFYLNKLDEIVEKDNNTYHRLMKIKPFHIHLGTYIEYDVENNKFGNPVKKSKHKNISEKCCTPN